MWCWRRLLRVSWTARRSNQSILKENSPDYSLEGLMLKLKLQYFGHPIQRADSLEKTLMLGKIESKMVEQHCWLKGYEFEQTLGDGEGQGSLVCCSPWGHKESDMTEWLNNRLMFLTSLLFSIYFLATPYVMLDPSSPTRNWTHACDVGSSVLTTGSLGKFPDMRYLAFAPTIALEMRIPT